MKNMAICYSEHAIKVSDSYCSGNSNQPSYNTSSHLKIPSIRNSVTSIYKIKLSTDKQFLIKLTWCNQLNQMFSISIFDCCPFSTSKFSKSFRILRGTKVSESRGLRIEVYWDLSRAKYESGPEPITGFYVIILVNSELSLILGNMERELEVKKCVFETRVSEFSLISRREYFSGNDVYSTKAKFCEAGICHDILIKCNNNNNNRVLCVYVDKKSVIEVKRLKWNFRGNETIFLDGLLVDLMWDVHDWLFSPTTKGYRVFLFRTRRGLMDSRLWLEDKSFEENEQQEEKVNGFSFLICAYKNPD
ncbi:hypothetical protein PHJA_002639400 [Phtheirospermum japonicum]|uniref:DUF868 domain-containing protein n=1 Tax=Phtheirospermum japonicum TaxID=374723 RepID=A0A830D2U0_9LAMI|nr:hypothetical protein PHJA_002639400 [Phtheirospermum japonicum]